MRSGAQLARPDVRNLCNRVSAASRGHLHSDGDLRDRDPGHARAGRALPRSCSGGLPLRLRRPRQRGDAEDVTQTTFANALRRWSAAYSGKPANWLITIAHNLIRQRFRQQQTRPHPVECSSTATSRRPRPTTTAPRSTTSSSPAADPGDAARSARPPRVRGSFVQGDRVDPGRLGDRAGNADLSGAPLARRRARESRHVRPGRARVLAGGGRPPQPEGAEAPRRAPGRVPELHARRCNGNEGPARVQVLVLLPLPVSLTLFQGAPSASAAIGLPTIGAGATVGGTAAGVAGGGVAVKVAIAVAAVAVAGGAGYEGVKTVREPAAPPAKAAPARVVPAVSPPTPVSASAKPKPSVKKPISSSRPGRRRRREGAARRRRVTPRRRQSRSRRVAAARPSHTCAARAQRRRAGRARTPGGSRSA